MKDLVEYLRSNFNSTMVRLEGIRRHLQTTADTHFNSTMVRLEGRPDWVQEGIHQFQFHYGTIRSANVYTLYNQRILFQFHYGTIRRKNQGIISHKKYYFNSTMVRLEEIMIVRDLQNVLISIPLWYD